MSDYRAWARVNTERIRAAHQPGARTTLCRECGERYPCGPARMAGRALDAFDARLRRRHLLASSGAGHQSVAREKEMDLGAAVWTRSSRCDNSSGNCVEVAFVDDVVAVRNSTEPFGPTLLHTRAEWDAFTAGIRAGDFA